MSLALKIYASRLRGGVYKEWIDLDTHAPGTIDLAALDQAIKEAVRDRLAMAKGFLESAKNLGDGKQPDDASARNSISRSYYSLHHVARAAVLYKKRFDPSGHIDAIERLCDLVGSENALRDSIKAKLTSYLSVPDHMHGDLKRLFRRFMEDRHHSDYNVYGASVMWEAPIDLRVQAVYWCDVAGRLYDAVSQYLKTEGAQVP